MKNITGKLHFTLQNHVAWILYTIKVQKSNIFNVYSKYICCFKACLRSPGCSYCIVNMLFHMLVVVDLALRDYTCTKYMCNCVSIYIYLEYSVCIYNQETCISCELLEHHCHFSNHSMFKTLCCKKVSCVRGISSRLDQIKLVNVNIYFCKF
jgi:hypothetical protein